MMTASILILKDIAKSYPAPSGGTVEVLKSISLEVEAGRSIAIVGPSGSGKSTLLNIIGTLDFPSAGSMILDGQELGGLGEVEKAAIRNRKIGFVFQQHHLLPQCNVLENVLVPTLISRSEPVQIAEARARALLDQVGLSHRLEYRPGQLSGGEQLRVAVVRAMINQPRLLLADEPTGSLDRAGAESLADLLVKMNLQQGTTLVVVTHSLSLARRMDRLYTLVDGALVPGNP
jgi:ABC-type lipoprotein export system ATPase subunit